MVSFSIYKMFLVTPLRRIFFILPAILLIALQTDLKAQGCVALRTVGGLGIKMPTGNYKAEDVFHYKLGTAILTRNGPVDQSIQPGDGGWGLTLE